MAATGMQFAENQLNAMYQQQMMTQQTYQQWIMALSPAQRMHLQQRMQVLMRDVQQQMAQIMQQARGAVGPADTLPTAAIAKVNFITIFLLLLLSLAIDISFIYVHYKQTLLSFALNVKL